MKSRVDSLTPYFPSFHEELNPSIYNDLAVQCERRLKEKRSADCANNQPSLFNLNAIAHVEADPTSLCSKPRDKARCMMEAKQARGLEIAAQHEITREGNVWIVPSQTSSKRYTVNLFLNTCTCADFDAHRIKCKHIYAAEAALRKESGLQQPKIPEQRKLIYRQEWHEYNLAQVNEKAKFQELLYELCCLLEDPPQHMGRPRVPTADRIFACCFKIYTMLSGRRFMSDLREAKQRGLISIMPHYNSIFRYLENEDLTQLLKELITESSLPLKSVEREFAADSSGFATGRNQHWVDTRWNKETRKYDESTRTVNKKDWLKAHIMCGCLTNVVTHVEITDAHAGDSPQFKSLVEATAENFLMKTVVADKAYSSAPNLKLVLAKGAQPYIPFRSNTNPDDKRSGSVWKRMYHYFMYNQEEFMRYYHKRSNVETTFSMIKTKFGERLRSKTETAQKNELLCKILCHNLCCVIQSMYELSVEPDFWNER